MRAYIVRITMADGSTSRHHGLYVDGFDAVICALGIFPDARRVSATRQTRPAHLVNRIAP